MADTRTIAQVIAEIEAALARCEAMVEEMKGKAERPEAAAEPTPEWDSFDALEEEAAEVYEQLEKWREAFWVHGAQGTVKCARDAIYSIRVSESIFARRFSLAACIKADGERERVRGKLRGLAAALDKINYSLNALIDEGKGDEALNSCRGPNRNRVSSALTDMDGAIHLSWEAYAPFKWRWLKEAAA